jgi:GT2 family glycosyltransferase
MNLNPLVSVIVPAHEGGTRLARCLAALRASHYSSFEIIVADDASTVRSVEECCREVGGVHVVRLAMRSGPAAARNAAARVARGEILLFIDSDVEVRPDTLSRVATVFAERPDIAALFGSYDDSPSEQNFLSQYKNLYHHFVHQRGRREAETFWAGCGAVRRAAFERVGGFDEARYREPSIEDIELGYRLRRSGCAILLDRQVQVKHLKRWSLSSLLRADIARRALPWSWLILERRGMVNDLNLRASERLCAVLVGFSVLSLLLSPFRPALLVVAVALLFGVAVISRELYAFFLQRRGVLFALAAFPLQALYYFYSGATFTLCWCAHKLGMRRFATEGEKCEVAAGESIAPRQNFYEQKEGQG